MVSRMFVAQERRRVHVMGMTMGHSTRVIPGISGTLMAASECPTQANSKASINAITGFFEALRRAIFLCLAACKGPTGSFDHIPPGG